ncbi:AAA family ATPase [Singulisphaera rosea]
MPQTSKVKIKEVRLRHYRAFANVRWELEKITFLVGRNGAGKSTLMDALSFISEAVTDSLGTALERRGNLEGIRQRQPGKGPEYDVSLAAIMELGGQSVLYGFGIGTDTPKSNYIVKHEYLSGIRHGFIRDRQSVTSDIDGIKPVPDPETLLFPLIAGTNSSWKAIYEALRRISVHQLSPQAIRGEPKIGSEERLNRDGSNAGDVLKHTSLRDHDWIEEHLQAAIPGLRGIKADARVGRRVILFQQEGEGGQANTFDASMMSDGTVRSLGILLALRQTPRPSIVLLDEIEDSLHPFAQSVLLDAIDLASEDFPIVVSTHNPEILSHATATPDRIRIVQWNEGTSQLYHLNREIRDNLRPPQTVGRLLRSNALWTEADPSAIGGEADFFKAL